MPKKLTYTAALEELQTITQELEENRVSLDDLAARVARARELLEFCRTKLRSTETEVARMYETEEE